ncbi:MAG: hypothetical protein ABR976_00370 [Terracidiphilus sp.]|jgi:hypothetical protein
MSDIDELRNALLNVLTTGLLRIRMYAQHDSGETCFIEADHLHNLPGLIKDPRPELVFYYFDRERPSFIKRARNVEQFEEEWDRLKMIIDRMRASSAK